MSVHYIKIQNVLNQNLFIHALTDNTQPKHENLHMSSYYSESGKTGRIFENSPVDWEEGLMQVRHRPCLKQSFTKY